MTSPPQSTQSASAFQQKIYTELDQRLKDSPWGSGASEAHGLLAGLACTGTTADTIRTRAYLLQLEESNHIEMLEGMFSLVLRDLGDQEFGFKLMLPDESSTQPERAEALSCWCQGFLQGTCYQDTELLNSAKPGVQEALNDIMEIGHIEIEADADPVAVERNLLELEEFMRVAVQLLYDELQPATSGQASTTIN